MLESVVVLNQLLPFPNEPQINNPPVVIPFSGAVQLQAGTKYWLRVSSVTGQDAWLAWNYNTTNDMGERAWRQNGGPWSIHSGQDPRGAFRLHGSVSGACYANCDGSTTPPVLNVADFSCFLTKFAAQHAYANCDGSCQAGVCFSVSDFSCFLTKFAAGCP